ncbi:MAG TPA: HAD family hydrolase [Candidatus Dormibacteraeota bacterium]|nr:HAD family hydrolase [Candidatus Dormibacteraeota bacterium]
MRTEAVLFDYGLTLVTFEYPTEALMGVLEGVRPWLGDDPPTAEWLMFHVLHPLEEDLDGLASEDEVDYLAFYRRAWLRAGLDLPDEVLYRILDLEQSCWDASVTVAPGALDLLDRLRSRRLLTGICSNAPFPPEMMARQLKGNGIGERMDAIVFSSAIGRRKPTPEPYLAAAAELGVEPGSVLFVGDRPREDYEGPLAVGMRAVVCTELSRAQPAPGVPTIGWLVELEDLL